MAKLIIGLFFCFNVFADDASNLINTYYANDLKESLFEIPLFPNTKTTSERKKMSFDLLQKEFKKITSASAALKEHSNELLTYGDCKSLIKESSRDCRLLMVSHRAYNVKSGDLQSVVNIYTSDIRNPFDKTSKINHVKITRSHWEIENKKAIKITDIKQIGPMVLDKDYLIKKCRNGAFIGWQCNDIQYHLYKISDSSFILLGKQFDSRNEPAVYTSMSSDLQSSEEISFTAKQRNNTADGTMSLALIKKQSNNLIVLYELVLSSFSDSVDAHRIVLSQRMLKQGLSFEYDQLSDKFVNQRRPASVSKDK